MSDEKIIAEEEMINEETTEVSEAVEKHPVKDFLRTKVGKIVVGTGLAILATIGAIIVLGRDTETSSGDFGVPGPDDDVSDEATTIEF